MTSRELVLSAFNHKETAEIPLDLGGHRSSGVAAIAYARLRDYLRLPRRPVRVYDPPQQLAVLDEDVLDLFGVDTIELGRAFAQAEEHWQPWPLPEGTQAFLPAWINVERVEGAWRLLNDNGLELARMPDGALYFEQTHFPFYKAPVDLTRLGDALEEAMWTAVASPPGPLAPDSATLREGALRLRASSDRALIGLFGGNLFEMGTFLYRMDRFLELLAADPDEAHAFLDKVVELHLANLETFLEAVGDVIDIILFGDDLGMQTGPLMSPAMYREFFKSRHALLWQRAKELAPVKVMLHSCGSLRALLPDLIEAGLDAVNPVQITCAGMEPVELKREFGRDLVFWGGGCDTREVLPHGTPAQVSDHVKRQISVLARDGGFVFQQVHNVMADVPPANLEAMLRAVKSPR